jgi:hypothetical protein
MDPFNKEREKKGKSRKLEGKIEQIWRETYI